MSLRQYGIGKISRKDVPVAGRVWNENEHADGV